MVTTSSRFLALAVAVLALGALPAGSALAAPEEQRGGEVLDSVQSGERDCDQLDRADFEAAGESVMGRMLGSPEAHEAMDRMMGSMMGGEDGPVRMHEVIGERFSGCGNPRLPGGYAGMMGAIGMMGGGPGPGGGMMGGGPGPGGGMMAGGPGPGFGMMGGDYDRDDGMMGDDGWWIAAAVLLLVVLAVGAVLLASRTGRSHRAASPLALLGQRFARGEISAEEYADRRSTLEAGAR